MYESVRAVDMLGDIVLQGECMSGGIDRRTGKLLAGLSKCEDTIATYQFLRSMKRTQQDQHSV